MNKLLPLILVLANLNFSFAQDDPCTAIPLPLSAIGSCTYIIGDNTGATDSSNANIDAPTGCDPVSANYNGADVWFYIDLGPTTTSINIDLTHISTSGFNDGVAALYTGISCSDPLTIVECDDDSGDDSGTGSLEANFSVLNGLTPGTRVFIRVWDWGGNNEGTFNICASEIDDPCASITNIGACGTTPINTTIASGFGAINDDDCFDVPGDETIFSFTPTVTGDYTITQLSTYSTSGISNHINYLYQTSCVATGWTCIDDLIGNNETSGSFNMVAGTTYYIMLDSENSNGGNVSFTLNCPIPPPPPPACGGTFYDSGVAGDYSNDELTTTTIFPDIVGDAVTATFTVFDLESGWDFLYVYNGPDATYPSLGTFSGTGIPGPFTSSDPSGALTFVFDSDSSGTEAGWEAAITCGPYVPPAVCGSTFYDNGGVSGNYFNDENTTTTLTPDIPGTAITATFTFFATESCCDDLSIYDGPDATYPLLGTFAGTTLPGSFTSSDPSGALTFVFESDFSLTYGGWAADITCTSIAPSCGDTFYDSGGAASNYANNENLTTIIAPINPGDTVTATFTSFNLDSGDTLEVFDGATSLGVFFGTTIPGPFTSTDPSGELTFTFISDGSGTQSGWAADITCSILCNISIAETPNPIGADDCTLIYSELVATSPGSPGGTTTVFSEDFSGATFPVGWNIVNGATSADWTISNSINSGGTANEAHLEWTTGSHISNWSISSPAINITDITNLQLSFKHLLSVFGTSTSISISLQTSINGTTWTNQYSDMNVLDDIPATTENVDISSLDGNTTLYLRFSLSGDTYDFLDWYIDDIVLTGDLAPVTPQITWTPITGLFTDMALTTPYVAGGFTDTVYAAPNGTQTYTATDQNSCTIDATVTRNRKEWNGTPGNTDWDTATNWFPNSVPTATDCVFIADTSGNNPVIGGTTNALGYNLTIEANATLTIDDDDTDTDYGSLTITDFIDLQGNSELHILNNSSLVQINEGAANANNNSGSGLLIMDREPYISRNDYVYWSSPVSDLSLSNIYGADTPAATYRWDTTIPNGTISTPPGPCTNINIPICFGDWESYSSNMAIGKGYISNGPTSQGLMASDYPMSITGTIPNNGLITHVIESGNNGPAYCSFTYQPNGNDFVSVTPFDDNWNLIGNPYPSAISANAFINYSNAGADNTLIEGAIHIWTHGTDPNTINPDPFYDDYTLNYNPNDYLTYNLSGTNTYPNEIMAADYFIGSGQGFFVLALNDNESGNVTFSNTMRDVTHDNSIFYRSSDISSETTNTVERHRIWLNLSNQNEQTSSTMVGYIEGATEAKDRAYDAYTFESNAMSIYSMIDDEKMVIQGRQLPFEIEDQVPLGVDILQESNYTISISGVDGLFNDNNTQDIYLEDTYQGVIHDLRLSPFSFTSETGTFNDRFILRYTNTTLGIGDLDPLNGIQVFDENNKIVVKSDYETIEFIEVYDILGRTLFTNKLVNSNRFYINGIESSEITLFIKIRLVNGKEKIAKIIF